MQIKPNTFLNSNIWRLINPSRLRHGLRNIYYFSCYDHQPTNDFVGLHLYYTTHCKRLAAKLRRD